MAPATGILALLTDFGLKDQYVGVLKGVILGLHPDARIVDLSHDVAPQDVAGAAFLLAQGVPYFPEGTVFVAVVDPGVGSDRAIVAVETDRHRFLAPDNGLLGFLETEGCLRRRVRVSNRDLFLPEVSQTFHGRDIFAPVAARLSRGLDLAELGPAVDRIATIPAPALKTTRDGGLVGEIVAVDRFGNLVTNIPGNRLPSTADVRVRVGRASIRRLSTSYAQAKKGELLAIVGSTGHLEVSVNQGDARKKTGSKVGDAVRVQR